MSWAIRFLDSPMFASGSGSNGKQLAAASVDAAVAYELPWYVCILDAPR